MRIGVFASHLHTTIDTIRHYMAMDLILPEKLGGQYDFDARCQVEYEDVQHFKKLGFTLAEIQQIVAFKRIGKLTEYEKSLYYRSLFSDKLTDLEHAIETYEASRNAVVQALNELEIPSDPAVSFGVPISALDRLASPVCGRPLILESGSVKWEQVMKGILKCEAGCASFQISEGILMAEDCFEGEQTPLEDPFEIEAYIQKTDQSYLNTIYKGLSWVGHHVPLESFSGMTFVELGVGHGFFLRHFYEDLPKDAFYFAVDRDLNRLRWLKRRLERAGLGKKVILVACDFEHMPLKNGCADVLVDYSGSSNYAFEHEDFLLDRVAPLLNDKTILMASYITFEKFSSKSKIEPKYRHGFTLRFILERIKSLGFVCEAQYRSKAIQKGGIYEDYFVDGEQVAMMICYGRRQDKDT
jgi:DNA-binding transcriptional MerR regulator/SAM-dependent methyltransferase